MRVERLNAPATLSGGLSGIPQSVTALDLPAHADGQLHALLLAEGAERTVEHLVRERAVRVARMRELTAARQRPGTTFQEVLAADHALAHLDADLRWIESARRRIHDLEGEIA